MSHRLDQVKTSGDLVCADEAAASAVVKQLQLYIRKDQAADVHAYSMNRIFQMALQLL